jgi:hypothetical protein
VNSQSLRALRSNPLRHAGPLILIAMLALLSSQGTSAASSAPSPSASSSGPTIPLGRAVFATCTRQQPWSSQENYTLSVAYNQGDWSKVQETLRKFVKSLTCAPKLPEEAYYSIVFLNEGLTAPALSRVLVHDPDPAPEIYGNRVGRYDVYDLQLLTNFQISVTTIYQATTTPNGAIAQLPSVLAKVAGAAGSVPISSIIPHQPQDFKAVKQLPATPLPSFVFYRVNSPAAFKRGGLATASVAPQVTVTDQLTFSPALQDEVLIGLEIQAQEEDKTGLASSMNKILAKNYLACTKPQQPCSSCNLLSGVPALTANQAHLQEVVQYLNNLNASYAALVALCASPQTPPSPLVTQYTFGNLTRWAFSLGVGYMGSPQHARPAKLDSNNNLVADPPSGAMTFVAADFHPWAYDETTFSPTAAERFRIFSGVALTPDTGFVVGIGESLIRGLTLEAGYAFLLGNVVPSDAMFGVPANSRTKPHRGLFRAPFIAIGYSFQ